ncbi:MAG: peptidase MA family metallohydrolase [Planctomycetes bacterium]|nr:peptidase MA family metallohydrolase [Planctomycetota bacterium]
MDIRASDGRCELAPRRPARSLTARGARAAGGALYALLALASLAGAQAPGYEVTDEGAYLLERTSVSGPTAARLRATWDGAVTRVEEGLGLAVPPRPRAILAPTDAEFARRLEALGASTAHADALAVAFPGQGVVVVRERGIAEGTAAGLEATLAHELAHLALGQVEAARGARLPRWLNEGLAEWASGRRPTRDEVLTLGGLVVHDELPSLESLAEAFPPHGVGRAYLLALSFVGWLDAQEGGGGVGRLVQALSRGASIDDAVGAASGRTLADAEAAWRDALRAEYSLAEVLLRSVTVWTIAGLLALLAIARHLWRRRRLLRALEAADAADEGEEDDDALPDEDEVTTPGPPPTA